MGGDRHSRGPGGARPVLTDTGDSAPDPSGPDELPDDLAESGRGLWLAHATLDELDYLRSGDRNTWRLVRRRSDGERPPA